jgi:predicted nucleotidyltransferase
MPELTGQSRPAVADHHYRAAKKAEDRLRNERGVIAVLMGGSVARGVARADSDVDLITVVDDAAWPEYVAASRFAFFWNDLTDYPGGYVEGRFVPRSYVLEAAKRGSEPTRHSFTAVYPLHSDDPSIDEALPLIPVYPEAERQYRITAFMAQLVLNKVFFLGEGRRRNDPYLQARAASDMVLFGGRLILAHNRILFPCQKRLMEYVTAAPQHPAHFQELATELLTKLSDESKEAFCQAVESFTNWGVKDDLLSTFLRDVEASWYLKTSAIAEW